MTAEESNPQPFDPKAERRKRMWWLIVALLGAVAAGVLLASTVWQNRWSDGEDVPANAVIESKLQNLETWCASQTSYDAIRRELFRRAVQVRGGDEQAYTRLADFALLRMSGPVATGIDDRLQSVSCNATAVLDLPPGVSTSGGQRSLSGDLQYVVQPSADGTGKVVRLGNSDSIVIPLATLSGVASSVPQVPMIENGMEGLEPSQPVELPDSGVPPAPEESRANPSFDCDGAQGRAEVTICNDPGLAALDRQAAQQYRSALMEASQGQRRLLERTRRTFLSYRDRCATNQCIAQTYQSRMREIADIMSGRWRG